jgi:hypothetical protein
MTQVITDNGVMRDLQLKLKQKQKQRDRGRKPETEAELRAEAEAEAERGREADMAGPDADAGHDLAQVAWPMTYLNNHARPLCSVVCGL